MPKRTRLFTGVQALDYVAGADANRPGLYSNASIVLSGAPGVGMTTMLVRACANLGEAGHSVLYVTPELLPTGIMARRAGVTERALRTVHAMVSSLPHGVDPIAWVLDMAVDRGVTVLCVDGIEDLLPNVHRRRARAEAIDRLTSYARSAHCLELLSRVVPTGFTSPKCPLDIANRVDALFTLRTVSIGTLNSQLVEIACDGKNRDGWITEAAWLRFSDGTMESFAPCRTRRGRPTGG